MACGCARAARVGAPAPAKPPSRRRGRPLRRHAGGLAAGGAGRAATLAAVSRRGGAGGAARLVGGARCVSAAGVEAPEQQRPERSSEAPQLQEGATWQIDFCSRPMLDERGKKVRAPSSRGSARRAAIGAARARATLLRGARALPPAVPPTESSARAERAAAVRPPDRRCSVSKRPTAKLMRARA